MTDANVGEYREQIAVLRAYLRQEFDEYELLAGKLDSDDAQVEFGELVGSAFFIASQQWSLPDARFTDVITFVANVRAEDATLGKEIDPTVAERILRIGYVDEVLRKQDDGRVFNTQLLLLLAMITQEEFDEVKLDDYLSKARELALSLREVG